MTIVPITLAECRSFVLKHHRHNNPPVGHKFSIGLVSDEGKLIGVASAGRPVARMLAKRTVLEINRTCTTGEKNANSMLYGAIRKAAVAMGYTVIYTYTQDSESGASLRAAGFREDAKLKAKPNWHEASFRGSLNSEKESTTSAPRIRWVWP